MIDLHCDTLSRVVDSGHSLGHNPFHFDISRALQAGLKVQFFALFSHNQDENALLRAILRQIAVYRAHLSYSPRARSIESAEELDSALSDGKLGCVLHLEGADALGKDAGLWPLLHHLGVRSLGLTWNHNNAFAGGVLDKEPVGLSVAGKQLLLAMEDMGSILDLAHVAPESYYQALEQFSGPVMVSHANTYSLCRHPRNLRDSQILTLAEHQGIIGINLVPDFIDENHPDLDRLVDHVIHIASLVGVSHVALGSDFDGADKLLLGGVEDYSALEVQLKARGFSEDECSAILHDNALAFLNKVFTA